MEQGGEKMQVNQLLATAVTQPGSTGNTANKTGNTSSKSDFMKLMAQLTGGSDNDTGALQDDASPVDSSNGSSPQELVSGSSKHKAAKKVEDNQQQAQSAIQSDQSDPNSQLLQLAQLVVKMNDDLNAAAASKEPAALDAQTLQALNLLIKVAQDLVTANAAANKQPQQLQNIETDDTPAKIPETQANANEQKPAALPANTVLQQAADQTMQTAVSQDTDTAGTGSVKAIVKEPGAGDAGQNISGQDVLTQPQASSVYGVQTAQMKSLNDGGLQRLFAQLHVTELQSDVSDGSKAEPQQGSVSQLGSAGGDQPMDIRSSETPQTAQVLLSVKALCESAPDEVNTVLKAAQSNLQDDSQKMDASKLLDLLSSANLKAEPKLENQNDAATSGVNQTNSMQGKIAQNIFNLAYNLNSSGTVSEPLNNTVSQTNSETDPQGNTTAQSAAVIPQVGQPVTAAQTDAAQQAPSMVHVLTPFQFKVSDRNAAAETKTDKKSGDIQTAAPQNGLKLTQDDAFKQVLGVTGKAQGDTANSDNSDPANITKSKTAGDMNVNAAGNVQAFTVNTVESPNQTQAQSLVHQTSNAVAQAVHSNLSNFKVHLSPEEMGGITIKMVSKNGTMSIQIIADNPRTGQLLSGSIGDLNTSIGQHGITVGKSEILSTGSNSNFFSTGDFSGSKQQTGQQAEQQTGQYKHSEKSAWKTGTAIADEQISLSIPQVSVRSYDFMA
jgi:hypothetical protein